MNRDKTAYTRLHNELSSPIEKDDQEQALGYLRRSLNHTPSRLMSYAIICLLMLTNIFTITNLVATKTLFSRLAAKEGGYIPRSAGSSPELLLALVNVGS
jgi:hypothetical protein